MTNQGGIRRALFRHRFGYPIILSKFKIKEYSSLFSVSNTGP
jgi:hypothetical protein